MCALELVQPSLDLLFNKLILLSFSPIKTDIVAKSPMDDLITFGLKRSTWESASNTASTPMASAVRKIAPKLPGFQLHPILELFAIWNLLGTLINIPCFCDPNNFTTMLSIGNLLIASSDNSKDGTLSNKLEEESISSARLGENIFPPKFAR